MARGAEPFETGESEAVAVVPAAAPGVVDTGVRAAWRGMAWPVFLLASSSVVWGATFSLARIATTAGAHPLGITLWQGLFGGLFLLSIAAYRRRLPPLSGRHLRFYLICGLLGTAIPSSLYFAAAARVPVGVVSITVAVVPIVTFVAAILFRVDRMGPGRVLGVLCGLGAVLLIVVPETSLPERAMVPWVLVAILAGTSYATENMFVALRSPPGTDAPATVGAMLLTATLVLAPIVAVTGTFVPLGYPWGAVEWSIIAMMLVNSFSYAVFYHLIQIAGPVFAAQTAYVVTLAGVAWGIVLFGEQHSLWVWASLVLMLLGLALVSPRPARRDAS